MGLALEEGFMYPRIIVAYHDTNLSQCIKKRTVMAEWLYTWIGHRCGAEVASDFGKGEE